jgi:H+/gluconate symporter-like permease
MGLLGILAGLGLLVWLSFRGWSVLLLAPAAALIAAAFAREPLLAHWTQTFMVGAAHFLAQFFPLFLLGAVFGKLMDDSGSVSVIARFMTERLGGPRRARRRPGGRYRHLRWRKPVRRHFRDRADGAGTFQSRRHPTALDACGRRARHDDVHHVGTARHAGAAKRHSHAVLRHNTFCRARSRNHRGHHPARLRAMVGLGRAESAARSRGEGYGRAEGAAGSMQQAKERERAVIASEFDPAEIEHGAHAGTDPTVFAALLPLIVVILVNLAMSLFLLPRLDTTFLAEERWGATSLSAVGGVWAVVVALAAAIAVTIALNYRRLPSLRASLDAGANASVLPALSVASLVGFGAVVAALPAFAMVRDFVLSIEGGPLVSLALAVNVLAALTGSASGGLTIALDALGETYRQLAVATGMDPALMHRVAVLSAGTLDSLPHNGAVVTLLSVCGVSHRESYFDLFMVAIVGALIALAAVIVLGSAFGSF